MRHVSYLAIAGVVIGVLAGASCERRRSSRLGPAAPAAGSSGDGSGPMVAEAPAEAKVSADSAGAAAAAAASSAALVPMSSSANAGECAVQDRPLQRPAARRIVALGDIHGDVRALAAALRAAKAVDEAGHWIGGELVVVQTGDVLDRGDDEQEIIDWLERLEEEAAAAGGALVWLLGNHELMNAAGDLRYVTDAGFRDFADVSGLPLESFPDVPERMRARVAAFAPAIGPYARILSGQDTVVVVGDTVFSHAGVTEAWAGLLAEVNRESRCFLASGGRELPRALVDPSSPVWTRDWGGAGVDCAALERALAAIGAKRMVVGHTTQPSGISSMCGERLWRIDVGLGASYGGPIEVLEIDRRGARAVVGQRDPSSAR